jgi:hypothetical protein
MYYVKNLIFKALNTACSKLNDVVNGTSNAKFEEVNFVRMRELVLGELLLKVKDANCKPIRQCQLLENV